MNLTLKTGIAVFASLNAPMVSLLQKVIDTHNRMSVMRYTRTNIKIMKSVLFIPFLQTL